MSKRILIPIILFALLSLHAVPYASTVTLPSSLITIEEEAFMGDTSLDEVIIPDGTENILDRAFADSSLQSITIPSSVTNIADDAFSGVYAEFYLEDANSFTGDLDDMGKVHLTEDASIDGDVSFNNTTLVIDEGVNIQVYGSLQGTTLIVDGSLENYGSLCVTEYLYGNVYVSEDASYTEVPESTCFNGTNLSMDPNVSVVLDGETLLKAIYPGKTYADITSDYPHARFQFIPSSSGEYSFISRYNEDGNDPYVKLYNADGEEIASDDDGAKGYNFNLNYSLDAGETYCCDVNFYDDMTGSIPLYLSRVQDISLDVTDITIENSGEWVRMRFIPEETGIYTLTSSSDSDTVAYLYDAQDNELAYNDDYDDDDDNFYITSLLNAGTDYYFEVKFFSSDEIGRMPLSMTYRPVDIQEISLGTTEAEITDEGDIARYSFTPSTDGMYMLTSIGDEDTFGTLYDATGEELVSSDDEGNKSNFCITYDLSGRNTYYYDVKYYSSSTTVTITLFLSKNLSLSNELAEILNGGDITRYCFTPAVDGFYTLQSLGDMDTYAALYDIDGQLLENDDDGGNDSNFSISYNMTEGTTYYYDVRYLSSETTGIIDLQLDRRIVLGDSIVEIITGGEKARLSYTPSVSGSYTFTSLVSDDTICHLYSATGNELTSDDDGGEETNFSITYDLDADCTYYYEVSFNSGETTGTISVCLEKDNDPSTYTVIYYTNGGTGAPANQTKTEGVDLILASKTPTKTNTVTFNFGEGTETKSVSAIFKNWNTSQDGSGDTYQPEETYSEDDSLTLYAQWNYGTLGDLPAPEKDGYKLLGWYTEETDGTKVTSSTNVTKNVTYYAHWAETYTVTYDANGGTGAPSDQIKTENQNLTLSSVKPLRTHTVTLDYGTETTETREINANFNGWNTREDGTGTGYASSDI